MADFFVYNENNPISCDAVIVDEVSMVDINLMYNLLKAIPKGAKLILVGDKEVQEAVQGQPVTIQLDREVDVSRGCVLTIDSGAVLTDSVEADTSGWMIMLLRMARTSL